MNCCLSQTCQSYRKAVTCEEIVRECGRIVGWTPLPASRESLGDRCRGCIYIMSVHCYDERLSQPRRPRTFRAAPARQGVALVDAPVRSPLRPRRVAVSGTRRRADLRRTAHLANPARTRNMAIWAACPQVATFPPRSRRCWQPDDLPAIAPKPALHHPQMATGQGVSLAT